MRKVGRTEVIELAGVRSSGSRGQAFRHGLKIVSRKVRKLEHNKACASILGRIKVLHTFTLFLFVLSLIREQCDGSVTPLGVNFSPTRPPLLLPAQGFVLTVWPVRSLLTRLASAHGPSSRQVRVTPDSQPRGQSWGQRGVEAPASKNEKDQDIPPSALLLFLCVVGFKWEDPGSSTRWFSQRNFTPERKVRGDFCPSDRIGIKPPLPAG